MTPETGVSGEQPSVLPTPSRPQSAVDVTPESLARLGVHLASAARAALHALDIVPRNALGTSRLLGVNRGTCQRVEETARQTASGHDALRCAPGVAGFREFATAMKLKGRVPAAIADDLWAAVQHYAEVVEQAGGKRAGLIRVLDGLRPTGNRVGSSAGDLAARRAAHEASYAVVGAWMDTNFILEAIAPSSNPAMLDFASINGKFGLQRLPGGLPVLFRTAGLTNTAQGRSLEGETFPGRSWSVVLAEFSSFPLPVVITRCDENTIQHAIHGESAIAAPVDLVLGSLTGHARTNPWAPASTEGFLFCGAFTRIPSRVLVREVYLHRSLAERANALALATAALTHHEGAKPSDAWWDVLPNGPTLEQFAPGLAPPESACPKGQDMARQLFARVGWDPRDFVAARIVVQFPLRGVGYVIQYQVASQVASQAAP